MGVETLSDHVHIEMDLHVSAGIYRDSSTKLPKRWSMKKLDKDKMVVALIASTWPVEGEEKTLDEELRDTMRTIVGACDVAMPRQRVQARRSTWWTDELSELRRLATQMRRRWLRARREMERRPEEEEVARDIYRETKYNLYRAITKAKSKSWSDLLLELDRDSWGLAYKIVRNKLKRWSPPTTELLDTTFLQTVVEKLFPCADNNVEGADSHELVPQPEWQQEWEISEREMADAVKKMASKSVAPGPDGIPGRAVYLAYRVMDGRIRSLMTKCLREGVFPERWRRANLVLLHKEGKPENLPSSYRPICLLDEMGKLLERVIVQRIRNHLEGCGPDLPFLDL